VNIATSRIADIGRLNARRKAPVSTATPPMISIKMVSRPIRPGAGTPRLCRIVMKCSGPFITFVKPCAMKPYPVIKRSGIAAQCAVRPNRCLSTSIIAIELTLTFSSSRGSDSHEFLIASSVIRCLREKLRVCWVFLEFFCNSETELNRAPFHDLAWCKVLLAADRTASTNRYPRDA